MSIFCAGFMNWKFSKKRMYFAAISRRFTMNLSVFVVASSPARLECLLGDSDNLISASRNTKGLSFGQFLQDLFA